MKENNDNSFNGYINIITKEQKTKIDNTIEIQKRKITELKKLINSYRSYINMLEETSGFDRLNDKEI